MKYAFKKAFIYPFSVQKMLLYTSFLGKVLDCEMCIQESLRTFQCILYIFDLLVKYWIMKYPIKKAFERPS